MIRPIEPNIEDCCDSGCNPCIFDVYEKNLRAYHKQLSGESTHEERSNLLSDIGYTAFEIIDTEDLCHNYKAIYFKHKDLSSKQTNLRLYWNPGQYFILKTSLSDKVLTRAYTPLKPIHPGKEGDFMIIVKLYEQGVVSKHLFTLTPKEILFWRGPYGDYVYRPNINSKLIMLAQGTGIVAFYNIILKILKNDEDMTKVYLLYCCKSLQSILFRNDLYSFKSYWNFAYEVFLSSLTICDLLYKEPVIERRLDIKVFGDIVNDRDQYEILICGSKDFMDCYKKKLVDNGFDDSKIVCFYISCFFFAYRI